MSEILDKQGRTGDVLSRNDTLCNDTLRNESLCKASPGNKAFRELRESGCIYVDKTSFAESLLCHYPPKASIILHPHGFGKSLGLSMLRDFCDIRQDSRAIFEGLAISENKEVCDKWMNQYPVVLVSLKDVKGDNYEEALDKFADVIGHLCDEYDFLRQTQTDGRSTDLLARIEKRLKERICMSLSLSALCRALHYHFGKQAIVLIDDYDVPLLHAQRNGYYEDMADFLGSLYGATMKGNENLKFGVLTGCLPYTNHSIISGFNNFSEYWPSHALYAGVFGFTSEEADKLLAATGFSAKKDEIQDWYKGYRMMDDTEVYCPRDIMACIAALQENPDAKPDQSPRCSVEREFLQEIVDGMTAYDMSKAEKLLAGGYISGVTSWTQFFTMREDDAVRLWYLLYLTGFLTMATEEQKAQSVQKGSCFFGGYCSSEHSAPLVIPNKHLRTLFIGAIDRKFRDEIAGTDRTELFRSFWAGDAKALEELFHTLLMKTATYYGLHNGYYHDFLTELFAGAGCESPVPGGQGQDRQEIVIPDPENDRCAVIGIEYAGDNELSDTAEKALIMARDRAEAAQLKGRYKNVVLWGMGFHGRFSTLMAETA